MTIKIDEREHEEEQVGSIDDETLLSSLLYDGIRVNKLRLRTLASKERGLYATSDIRPKETILTIPTRHLINLKVTGKEFGYDWRAPPLPAHVALALHLLLHRSQGRTSPYHAYIQSLPESFGSVPLTWEEHLIAELPLSTQHYVAKQKTVFGKHYQLACTYYKTHGKRVFPLAGSQLDQTDFTWAWLAVNTRCIFQSLSNTSTRDDNYACAPLIDMINHVASSVPHCRLLYDIKGLHVISESYYAAGDEIFISYGAHDNEALLCEYGFVIGENNPDNTFYLDYALANLLRPHHIHLLMELDYYEDCTLDYQGRSSFRTEVTLRVLLLNKDDCAEDSDKFRRLLQFINGYSSGSSDEQAVWTLLAGVLEQESSAAGRSRAKCTKSSEKHVQQIWRDREQIATRALRRWN